MNLFELYLLVTITFLSFLFDLEPRSLQSSSEKTSGEWLWHSQVGCDRQTGLFVFQLTLWTLQTVQSKQQKDTETRMWCCCRFFVNSFNIYRYSIFSHRLLMFPFPSCPGLWKRCPTGRLAWILQRTSRTGCWWSMMSPHSLWQIYHWKFLVIFETMILDFRGRKKTWLVKLSLAHF